MNIESLEHWVLLVLDLSIQTVTLYDSTMGNKEHDNEVDKCCETILKFLPLVLDSLGVFYGFENSRRGTHPFAFRIIDNNSQQNNGLRFLFSFLYWYIIVCFRSKCLDFCLFILHFFNSSDCGIFFIKNTEFLMVYQRISKVTQQQMRYFSKKITFELHSYG